LSGGGKTLQESFLDFKKAAAWRKTGRKAPKFSLCGGAQALFALNIGSGRFFSYFQKE
jgi:hypothetical protein